MTNDFLDRPSRDRDQVIGIDLGGTNLRVALFRGLSELARQEGDERGRLVGEVTGIREPLASLLDGPEVVAHPATGYFRPLPSSPDDLHSLLTASFVLVGTWMVLGVIGHLTQLKAVIATGIALVFAGGAFFVVAVGQFG